MRLNCVLIITIVGLNGVSILTIHKSPALKQKVYYYLILLQSCADLTVDVVGLPLHVYFVVSELLGVASCLVNFLSIQIMICISCFSLAVLSAITLERYYGTLYPILHRTKMTKRKIRKYTKVALCDSVHAFSHCSMVQPQYNYNVSFSIAIFVTVVLLLLLIITY